MREMAFGQDASSRTRRSSRATTPTSPTISATRSRASRRSAGSPSAERRNEVCDGQRNRAPRSRRARERVAGRRCASASSTARSNRCGISDRDQRVRRVPGAMEDPQGGRRRFRAAAPGPVGGGRGRAAGGRDALAVRSRDHTKDLRGLRPPAAGPRPGRPRLGQAPRVAARCPRLRPSSRARTRRRTSRTKDAAMTDSTGSDPQPAAPPASPSSDDRIGIEDFQKVRLEDGEDPRRRARSEVQQAHAARGRSRRRDSARSSRASRRSTSRSSSSDGNVVVVANLKPAKLMGVESNGMVLAASVGEAGAPSLLDVPADVPPGRKSSSVLADSHCHLQMGTRRGPHLQWPPRSDRAAGAGPRGGRDRGSWSRERPSPIPSAAAALRRPRDSRCLRRRRRPSARGEGLRSGPRRRRPSRSSPAGRASPRSARSASTSITTTRRATSRSRSSSGCSTARARLGLPVLLHNRESGAEMLATADAPRCAPRAPGSSTRSPKTRRTAARLSTSATSFRSPG